VTGSAALTKLGSTALPLPKKLQARVAAWDAGHGGAALAALSSQFGNVLQAAGVKQYVPMKRACVQLAAEVAAAQAGPPIPDAAMQRLYAKALADFARATQLLAFKGGLMDGAALSPAEVTAISRLPSREVLYGQLVGLVASPISGLARTLNALIANLAVGLGQVRDQKQASEPAPADSAGSEAQAPTDEPSDEPADQTAAAQQPDASEPKEESPQASSDVPEEESPQAPSDDPEDAPTDASTSDDE